MTHDHGPDVSSALKCALAAVFVLSLMVLLS